jgi:2-phospho-L-lactate/phosphoenolpyruvate guanylyltransferase
MTANSSQPRAAGSGPSAVALRTDDRPARDARRWTVLVPVKLTAIAKSRLSGVTPQLRQRLAVAFALDTVAAALRCSLVDRVLVVTDDPAGSRFATLGAVVVPDEPDAGLNPALEHAWRHARRLHPLTSIAAISSDLPALRPDDLERALTVTDHPRWFVSDAAHDGTTMIASVEGAPWTPRFGQHSRVAHRAAGMFELDIAGIERLRRDVDTDVDLRDAERYGLGPETAKTLVELDALA